ncbi:protein FAR1-RELATED SEQUENCE [Citrus sinensis]|nr:protein FAR1-RELATED SEQUENCE [Citrus sinensis]
MVLEKALENQVTEKLFCSCPSLTELCLTVFIRPEDPPANFIIQSITLNTLTFVVLFASLRGMSYHHRAVIMAPNLQQIRIVDNMLIEYKVHEMQSIQQATLDVKHWESNTVDPQRARNLVEGVAKTTRLILSSGVLLALKRACKRQSLIRFDNLTYLDVKVRRSGWKGLYTILTAPYNLRTCILTKGDWFDINDHELGWLETENVPPCLSERVTKIKMKAFTDGKCDLVHHIRSHRGVTGPDLSAALSLHKVGEKPSQIHEFMVDRSGGYDKVGYNRRGVENRLVAKRHESLKESDAETCLSYLDGRQSSDPSFFYDFTITSSNRLGDLFWCDDGSCAVMHYLVMLLHSIQLTRPMHIGKPLVVILGINHHRRTIVFGFVLLSNETEHTYTWLLETLMTAMNNKHPRTVVTNGDKAMRNAISKTFPEVLHRLCCWHLVRNAQTNIKNPKFTTELCRCMMNAYTKEEFDRKWKLMVHNHNIAANEWVVKMFEDRHMWADAYLRGKFFGGMRSTQRSEGMNAYLNHYVNRRLRLIEFVKQMDRLMDRQRE